MISVVFIGTSSFALPTLEALHNDAHFRILGVLTQPAKPVGRKHEITPSPVEKKAKTLGLKVWSPEKINDMAIELAAISPDCLVVASYGQILPKDILAIPHLGTFNIHPSLLPKYRGASPVPAALLADEKETGVSIMLMDEEMDHGPILRQKKLQIGPDMTAPELLDQTAHIGAKLLPETIINFNAGKLTPEPQRHETATFSKIFTREDGKIDFLKTTDEIYNQYRALTPWPGVFAKSNNQKTIKFLKLAKAKTSMSRAPSTLFIDDNYLYLGTIDGALFVDELQTEAGKPMNAAAFINGYKHQLPLPLK